MRILLFSTLALIGCTKDNPDYCPAHPTDPRCGGMMGSADAGTDGKMADAAPDAPSCFGSGAFEVCPMGATTGTQMLSGTIDTTMGAVGSKCASSQLWKTSNANTCFIVADSITVMDVRVTGARPLALVANMINVMGHLDASSKVADAIEGPNALNPGTCGTPGTPANNVGAGGGAGASFAPPTNTGGQNGGSGGAGANGAGSAYSPFLAVPPGTLRAGCRGQQGGTGQGAGGVGGYGGGGVYLAASTSLSIGASGIINASGAGGGIAAKSGGGGGGGSGGMVILWAGSFTITNGGKIVANGGSGSTGGNGSGAGTGTQGNDPDPTHPMTGTAGPTTPAGAGGAGFAQGSAATVGGPGTGASDGGGGGGGGGGYVQSNAALTNATVSPAANVVP